MSGDRDTVSRERGGPDGGSGLIGSGAVIDPRGVYGLWLRDLKRFLRAPSRVLGTLALPLVFLVFLGFGFQDIEIPGMPAEADYIQFVVPGILGFTMLFGASLAGLSIIFDRDVGFLKEILVTPTSRTSVVLGRVAGGSTTSFIQAGLLFVVALAMGFRVSLSPLLPVAAAVLVLLAVIFVGFGVALASLFQDSEGYGLVIQLVIFPLFFLSGAIYPVEALPAGASHVAFLNPLTYGIDALRVVLTESPGAYPLWVSLAVLSASAAAMVAAGSFLFSRVETS